MKKIRHSEAKPLPVAAVIALAAIICLNLIFPLMTLLLKAVDHTPFYKGFADVLLSGSTIQALFNSVKVSLTASLLSVSAAFFYAYIVEYKLKGGVRRFFRFFSVMPMLVPSITHGIVIVYLFGKMGIFTRLFGVQLPIYGSLGIVMGSFFYAFPMAFLLLSQAFSSLDGRLFENALVLGVKPVRRLFEIVFPVVKYAVFSACAVCFTMIFTDYGIPLSVGGTYPILPILFYKNVVGMLDFSKGAIYSTLILVPSAIVYLLDIFVFSKKQISSRHNSIRVRTGPFVWAQKFFFVLASLLLAIPMFVIAVSPFIKAWPYDISLTLEHFHSIFMSGKLSHLTWNSIVIALLTGLLGMALTCAAGYCYTRNKGAPRRLRNINHGLYMTSLAVPGLALGLSFAMFFKGTFIYNTLAILVFVNITHFLGSPYLMAVSHFKLLNPNLEAVCRSLGGGALRVIFNVIIPNSRRMMLDVFVYFFTNAMITISAVSLLYNTATMTLALQITAFNDQGDWESAIAVSLVILAINTAVKLFQTMRRGPVRASMPEISVS